MRKQLILMILLLVLYGCGDNNSGDAGNKKVTEEIEEKYKLSFMSIDNKADNIIDRNMSITYNKNGDILVETTKWNYQDKYGEESWIFTNSYDDNGILVATSHLNNHNRTSITTYTYDKNGNKIKEVEKNSDGEIESIDEYAYDKNHNILTDIRDYNGDRVIDYITRYTYNEDNKILTEIETMDDKDIANNIISRETIEYTYDANGNLIKEIQKEDDGDITIKNTYTYDSNNNLMKEIEEEGEDVTTTTYTYDDKSNPLTISEDSDSNGVIDIVTTSTYTYSDNEKKAITHIDNGNDGTIDDISTYIWIKI